MAADFRDLLAQNGRFAGAFETVVFAVLDPRPGVPASEAFRRRFGEVSPEAGSTQAGTGRVLEIVTPAWIYPGHRRYRPASGRAPSAAVPASQGCGPGGPGSYTKSAPQPLLTGTRLSEIAVPDLS
ncbi:MAG: hypothetical protein U5K43_09630 [Halofilum sp. (in: g-proteobacteria)]|nr:hypothetical protein [Halofilum sp. (in: g-proteobacteria)]